MSAKHFVIQATRTGHIPSEGINHHGRCCCHPRAWGAKKGLRRARRRVDKQVIRNELTS
jgi:hypothetical protein